MPDTDTLFKFAEADDADALMANLTGRDGFSVRNGNGETLFLFSLYRGHSRCAEALRKRGTLTLQEAAAAGDVARVRECLKSAPWTIQSLSADGWPALHLAAFLGSDDALVVLLESGADARQWARAVETNLAIHAAAAGRRLGRAAIARLIQATGDPNILQKQGYSALMIAAANGFGDAVEALLAADADRSIKTADGKNAAAIAKERGHASLAERLGL
jgi:ankyrin repeat protein